MQENQDSDQKWAGIERRVTTLEGSLSRTNEAFVKNDLGTPDYDGHRKAHSEMIDDARVISSYKRDMTKKVLEWLMVGAAVLIGQGALEWLKGHLK